MEKSITVETDHKPLVPLLSTHTLDQLPITIQKFRMRLMRFHFKEIKHVSKKKIHIAEELSRVQIQGQRGSTTLDNDKVTACRTRRECDFFTAPSDIRLDLIRDVQEEDPVYRQIKMYCLKGWPDKYSLNDAMKPCRSSRGELSRSYEVKTPTSTTRRNRVHLTTLPEQLQLQQQPLPQQPQQRLISPGNKATTPILMDIIDSKMNLEVPPCNTNS